MSHCHLALAVLLTLLSLLSSLPPALCLNLDSSLSSESERAAAAAAHLEWMQQQPPPPEFVAVGREEVPQEVVAEEETQNLPPPPEYHTYVTSGRPPPLSEYEKLQSSDALPPQHHNRFADKYLAEVMHDQPSDKPCSALLLYINGEHHPHSIMYYNLDPYPYGAGNSHSAHRDEMTPKKVNTGIEVGLGDTILAVHMGLTDHIHFNFTSPDQTIKLAYPSNHARLNKPADAIIPLTLMLNPTPGINAHMHGASSTPKPYVIIAHKFVQMPYLTAPNHEEMNEVSRLAAVNAWLSEEEKMERHAREREEQASRENEMVEHGDEQEEESAGNELPMRDEL